MMHIHPITNSYGLSVDLRQLRYFLAITDRGSITGAAEVLGVAQPALSLHLKNMEAELGTKLLERHAAGVTPTEAGRLLASRARSILDDVARMTDDIRTLEAAPTGTVRIGLPGTIAELVALPLIEAVHDQYPGVTLNILEGMSGFVSDWLTEGRVDIGVLYSAPKGSDVTSQPLLDEELVLILAADADSPTEIALPDLDAMKMVLPSPAHGLRALIDLALGEIDVTPQLAVEIDAYASIKSLVSSGYGASILPYHAVARDVSHGRLKAVHVTNPGLWRRVHLVAQSNRPATRAQTAVRDVLHSVIQKLLEDGHWTGARPAV